MQNPSVVAASIFVVARPNRVIGRSRSSLIKSSLVVAVSPFLRSRRVPSPLSTNDESGIDATAKKKRSENTRKREVGGKEEEKKTTAGPDHEGPRRKDANQHANAPIRHVAKRLHQIKLRQIRLYTPLPRSSEPRVVQVVDKSVSLSLSPFLVPYSRYLP